MKNLRFALMIVVVALGSYTACAQKEIVFFATGGARAAYDQLIPTFESKTGYKVKVSYSGAVDWERKILEGASFDVVSIPYEPDWAASGNVVASSEKTLAIVPMGVIVHEGIPKPDISTAEAVKKMLLSAKSVSYNTAYAGEFVEEMLKELGIFDQIQAKLKRGHGTFEVMKMVGDGGAEIGISYMSELYYGARGVPQQPGVVVVGELPEGLRESLVMTGFVSSHAKDPAGAKAFLDFISSPEAASAYEVHHIIPGSR